MRSPTFVHTLQFGRLIHSANYYPRPTTHKPRYH
jgi:hypothetical protein